MIGESGQMPQPEQLHCLRRPVGIPGCSQAPSLCHRVAVRHLPVPSFGDVALSCRHWDDPLSPRGLPSHGRTARISCTYTPVGLVKDARGVASLMITGPTARRRRWGPMERHNIHRANQGDDDAGDDLPGRDRQRCRYRPSQRPVAFDRPREEQTWPSPLLVRTSPPRMTLSDAHPDWPGRKRPAVPAYQRRLDRHTDGIVSSFRSRQAGRTMAGRRRGMTTHRRPLAVVGATLAIGRGTDAHIDTLFAGSPMVYRRLRAGGAGLSRETIREATRRLIEELHGSAVVSPRRAVIAMVAVVVLVMGAMGTGLA